MTRVVIVGEIYNADLSVGGGPIYPSAPGSPSHPWVPPPAYPSHPIQGVPPGYWGGVAPPYPDQGLPGQPPGYWGGVAPPHPDQGLPGGQGGVPTHPIELPEPLPPPPPEIAHNVVVAVWNPTSEAWSVRVGEVKPTPHA
jgi:hypothetical protein